MNTIGSFLQLAELIFQEQVFVPLAKSNTVKVAF